MKYTLCFGIVIWVVYGAFLFAQSNHSSPEQNEAPHITSTSQKQQSPPVSRPTPAFRFNDLSASSAIQRAARAASVSREHRIPPFDVLSDTRGVDFRPYLQVVVKSVKQNWYTSIPQEALPPVLKKGKVMIEFHIFKDGSISGMKLAEDGSLEIPRWITQPGMGSALPIPFRHCPANSPANTSPYVFVSSTTQTRNQV